MSLKQIFHSTIFAGALALIGGQALAGEAQTGAEHRTNTDQYAYRLSGSYKGGPQPLFVQVKVTDETAMTRMTEAQPAAPRPHDRPSAGPRKGS